MEYLKCGFCEMAEFGYFLGTYWFWNPVPISRRWLWKMFEGFDFECGAALVLGINFGKFVYPLVEYLGGFGCGN